MSELRGWLRTHKLEQYADAFEASDVDLDILSELTEQDLAELGLSLGNRRRLLRAIAERNAAAAQAAPKITIDPTAAAERRQVTVLFCDLVGSTELASAIDPELLGELIRRYQDAVAGAIGRFGGFVAKFMGDGVLAYFGFPRAFEDAAERAVRAALAIVTEIGNISGLDGSPLQARLGLATGLVVVGEIVGTGSAQEHSIAGETPNLAARLQGLAAPGAILLSETTQRLLGGLFELEALGPFEVKGFARRVPAWRVLQEAAVASRFAAMRAGGRLPLVGRAHEIGLLRDRWHRAVQGEGQIVTVIGEAGIGKSRAVEALHEAIADEPHTRIHLQCSPYHSDSALYPVIQHLGRAARFAAADAAETLIAKLRVLFAERTAADAAAIPLLAELLSIPVPPTPPLALSPAQRKAATIALLIDEMVRLGDLQPVLLIVEDAHWIDATTLELLTSVIDHIGSARLLAVVTARPDFSSPWLARPHAASLTLSRLSREECVQLAAGVAATRGLPAETLAAIVAKTDGVPLFVEELTRSVLEATADDATAVPATLKDSLMARLDRLGEAREVAQIAAVIGRQFGFALLDKIVPNGGAELEAALEKLVAAGIVFPEGRGGERNFSFKHALVRDAAYESLLLARRRELHARLAHALESDFLATAAAEPELLAHHFGAARLAAEACDYRERAGDRAAARSAFREAIAHYSAGIAEADRLAEEGGRLRHRLALLLKLGAAHTIIAGAQSPEAEATWRSAAELGVTLQDRAATYRAKWGLWFGANIAGRTAAARDQADELVALAESSGDGDLLLEAYHCRWSTALFRGDLAVAQKFACIASATYDIARHRHLGPDFGGHDPGVCAHGVLGVMGVLSAVPEEARHQAQKAIALSEALDHPFSRMHAFYNAAIGFQIDGDRERAGEMAERMIALADKYGFPGHRTGAVIMAAWAAAAGPDSAAVVEKEIAQAVVSGPNVQYTFGVAAAVMLNDGRCDLAMALLDRGLAVNQERDVGYYLAEIWRLRGECLLALDRGNTAQARQAFAAARDIARRQGAVVFERRAEAALAALLAR
jgi:class 3 adenylate cyclase/tetratricopeptide (TPR) repeat protein